jgi:serine/threonine protein phosphatase PrpC
MAHSVNRQSFDTQFSGTTMNTILIQDGGRLLCANLGDSRAILGRIASQSKFKPFPLSIDHKPCLEKEMHRIH